MQQLFPQEILRLNLDVQGCKGEMFVMVFCFHHVFCQEAGKEALKHSQPAGAGNLKEQDLPMVLPIRSRTNSKNEFFTLTTNLLY